MYWVNKMILYLMCNYFRLLWVSVLLLFTITSYAQKETKDADILEVMNNFRDCMVHYDSVKFYNLFHTDPVTWVGVFHDASQAEEVKQDSTWKRNFFNSNYKSFYRSLSKQGLDREDFYNIQIIRDEVLATVMFDYSFWHDQKKINWGKETWSLIKANGQWKITNVIFSLEMENVRPEPKRKKK